MKRELGLIILLGLFNCLTVHAVESADVLPKDIHSISLRTGTVTGLNQYYTDSGELKYLSDINAVNFDVMTLSNINASVQDLVNVMNQFSPERLGDQLNLGQLKVNADPEVRYFAPLYLQAVNKNWTLGVGIPVVTYTNELTIGTQGSNLAELRSQFAGASPEVDAAIAQLNLDLKNEFQNYVVSRGYDAIENKDEMFLGDIQLISAYQLPKFQRDTKSVYQFILGLPTGPSPDPDDLTDIENFGRWTIKQAAIADYRFHARSKVVGSISYLAVLPGTMEKRVPKDSNDDLPAAEQKDNISEDIGDTLAILAGISWDFTSNFTTTVALSHEEKSADKYGSSDKGNSSLLEQNTNHSAEIGKIEFNYNTTNDYLNKKAMIPATYTYEISQVFAGRNIENQTKHELWVSVYF